MNKTLEEIKKEYKQKLYELVPKKFGVLEEELWQFIESTISQTKQELIEEIEKRVEKLEPDCGDTWDEWQEGFADARGQLYKLLEKLSNK